MSLSTLPLPSISLVLTSNLSYIPSVLRSDQAPFPAPQIGSTHGVAQHQPGTVEFQQLSYVTPVSHSSSDSTKKRKIWLHVLRRRHESSESSAGSTSSLLNSIRKLLATRGVALPLFRHTTQN